MADHSYYEELIGSELDGELTEEENAALAAHLRECDACRRYRSLLRSVSEAIPGETVTPPDTLSRAVMARVRALPGETAPERKSMTWGKQRAALSAVAAVIVLGSFAAVRLGTMRAGSAAPQAPMAAPAAEVMLDSPAEAEEAAPAERNDAVYSAASGAAGEEVKGAPLAPADMVTGENGISAALDEETALLAAVSGDEPAERPPRPADFTATIGDAGYDFWYEGERLLFGETGADTCFESPLSVSEFLRFTNN